MTEPKPAKIFAPMRQLRGVDYGLQHRAALLIPIPISTSGAEPASMARARSFEADLQASPAGGADQSKQSWRHRSSPGRPETRRARTARRAAPAESECRRARRCRARDRPGARPVSSAIWTMMTMCSGRRLGQPWPKRQRKSMIGTMTPRRVEHAAHIVRLPRQMRDRGPALDLADRHDVDAVLIVADGKTDELGRRRAAPDGAAAPGSIAPCCGEPAAEETAKSLMTLSASLCPRRASVSRHRIDGVRSRPLSPGDALRKLRIFAE